MVHQKMNVTIPMRAKKKHFAIFVNLPSSYHVCFILLYGSVEILRNSAVLISAGMTILLSVSIEFTSALGHRSKRPLNGVLGPKSLDGMRS